MRDFIVSKTTVSSSKALEFYKYFGNSDGTILTSWGLVTFLIIVSKLTKLRLTNGASGK